MPSLPEIERALRERLNALVNLEHLGRHFRQRLDALGPAPRAQLLPVLMLPDFERADRIGEFWGYAGAAPSQSC